MFSDKTDIFYVAVVQQQFWSRNHFAHCVFLMVETWTLTIPEVPSSLCCCVVSRNVLQVPCFLPFVDNGSLTGLLESQIFRNGFMLGSWDGSASCFLSLLSSLNSPVHILHHTHFLMSLCPQSLVHLVNVTHLYLPSATTEILPLVHAAIAGSLALFHASPWRGRDQLSESHATWERHFY